MYTLNFNEPCFNGRKYTLLFTCTTVNCLCDCLLMNSLDLDATHFNLLEIELLSCTPLKTTGMMISTLVVEALRFSLTTTRHL